MSDVGTVTSLWRYPVKSMRGEELESAFVGFGGIYGDRVFAFTSKGKPAGFPWVTGREQASLVLYRPRFRHPDETHQPPNLAEAEKLGPGVTPIYGPPESFAVEVETPEGRRLALDDPALLAALQEAGGGDDVTLVQSDRAMTDCRPVSLFSLQTARALGEELGADVDPRRFRANVYIDLKDGNGFGEDAFVGKRLQLGGQVVVSVLERDPRCKMISIDPDSAEQDPWVLKTVSRGHDGMAGVYGAVLVEGTVRPGDSVRLLE